MKNRVIGLVSLVMAGLAGAPSACSATPAPAPAPAVTQSAPVPSPAPAPATTASAPPQAPDNAVISQLLADLQAIGFTINGSSATCANKLDGTDGVSGTFTYTVSADGHIWLETTTGYVDGHDQQTNAPTDYTAFAQAYGFTETAFLQRNIQQGLVSCG